MNSSSFNDSSFQDAAARWQAVANRDPKADGRFVYAVKSTGIYCRPSCPSRRPSARNVEFFVTGAQAEHAGYRACKRCTPDAASRDQEHRDAIRRACALIETADEPPSLQTLADAAGFSRFHFHRLFKEIVGVTPKEYAATRRMNRLQRDLKAGASVTDAIYSAGFGSSSRVYEDTAKTLGMTPSTFRSGASGVRIRFTIAESALGWLLVAATDQGVCAIELGDDPGVLRERLHTRFPKARVEEDESALAGWVREVAGFIRSPQRGLELPLDIQGTAFQRRVWKALQSIPAGRTASYSEIAAAIGQPRAVRAVAQACASNKIALAIPCHRVVRADGESGGYRWGVERKRRLLAAERSALPKNR